MAQKDLVSLPVTAEAVSADDSSKHSLPLLAEQERPSLSQPADSAAQSLTPSWFQHMRHLALRRYRKGYHTVEK